MISAFSAIITFLILIPTVPLVLYAIGLFLPSSHIVTRSAKYNTTPEILWAILTSVEDYPAWRSNIDRVTVRRDDFENDLNKYEDHSRLTFVEYSKKNRRAVVMHIEQEPERKLLRVLDERPSVAPGEEIPKTKSTFTGSWTFTIEPVEGEEKVVTLKITEQGVINKPMVRVSHMLFFGYHRRIDRFLKDLGKEIDLGILDTLEEEQEKEENTSTTHEHEEEYEAGPDDSIIQTEANTAMSESKMIEKEWDIL